MKKTTTLFLFIFLNLFLYGQEEEDNFFFTKDKDSLGISYGKCLTQSIWETQEKEETTSEESRRLESVTKLSYDTIQVDFYYLKNIQHFKHISHLADTSRHQILLSEERRRLITCTKEEIEYCLETVTEQYIKTPSYKKWSSGKSIDISKSNHWNNIEIKEQYGVRTRRVIKTPDCCGTREEVIPAEYKTLIKVTPKNVIKDYELNNIKILCENSYVKTRAINSSKEKVIPQKTSIQKNNVLVQEAGFALKRIIERPSQILIALLQKQLKALGFHQAYVSGDLDTLTKEVIIKYQLKHNLPFGQLTEETVNHILSQKRPFNK